MARKFWQSIPFKPVMVLAAFLYGALWLGLPYPGRYQFLQYQTILYRVDRMTGKAWQRHLDGAWVLIAEPQTPKQDVFDLIPSTK